MIEDSIAGAPPTVSSGYVRAIYNAALSVGIDKSRLNALIDGNVKDLEIGTRRFQPQALLAMFELAAHHLGAPAIGVKLGSQVRPERRLDVIYAASFCQTLGEAMALNIAYQPLIQSLGRTTLERDGKFGRCVLRSDFPESTGFNIFKQTVFTGYASIGRWLVWMDRLPIERMSFTAAAPENLEPYHQMFGPNVEFGAKVDELVFDAATLDLPIPSRNPEILARLKLGLDQKMSLLNKPENTKADVMAIITSLMSTGSVSIQDICDRLDISERTLRRRLGEQETSFTELLTKVRQDSSNIYMLDKNMSLAEIAQALGFHDQSAFSRAFKSWTGKSPKAFRESIST